MTSQPDFLACACAMMCMAGGDEGGNAGWRASQFFFANLFRLEKPTIHCPFLLVAFYRNREFILHFHLALPNFWRKYKQSFYSSADSSSPRHGLRAAPNASRSSLDSSSNDAPTSRCYPRGGPDIEQDRSELFSGEFTRSFLRWTPKRFPAPGEENDDDLEGIKQSPISSSRNALDLARESEETLATLTRPGD
ncbi:hypothetical protein BT96DRAFT_995528 [Gymnopus androsaceus JB14]|uniref:Uncharacterized protein n=1 Tax=Gymnopus androsaceus JB14 TaxID=1447944 RepID=A0A6A4HI13_9AGAR|nr:hypothetical protein BT96DRAFT_995528 [Gymnopus androsaceus JB14]